jgi:hypothetical protein
MFATDIQDLLEPGSVQPSTVAEQAINLSIAISLKRIADELCASSQHCGIVRSLLELEMSIRNS